MNNIARNTTIYKLLILLYINNLDWKKKLSKEWKENSLETRRHDFAASDQIFEPF